MTRADRAADRLRRRRRATSAPEGCWYDLVRGALEGALRRRSRPTTARARCCAIARRRTPRAAHARQPPSAPAPAVDAAGLAATAMAAAAPARAAPITPSGFVDDPRRERTRRRRRRAAARASLRGNIVHRLMQSLPDIPPERASRGRAPLSRAPEDGLHRGRARRDREPGRWPCSPIRALRALFAPGSRAEVPIVGRVGDRTVDRPGRPAGGHAPTRC